jgi:hypothetical protein
MPCASATDPPRQYALAGQATLEAAERAVASYRIRARWTMEGAIPTRFAPGLQRAAWTAYANKGMFLQVSRNALSRLPRILAKATEIARREPPAETRTESPLAIRFVRQQGSRGSMGSVFRQILASMERTEAALRMLCATLFPTADAIAFAEAVTAVTVFCARL